MTERQRRAVLGRLARFEAERNAAKSETAVQEKTKRLEDAPKTKAELLFQGQLNPTRKRKIVRLEQWVEVTIHYGVTIRMTTDTWLETIEIEGKRTDGHVGPATAPNLPRPLEHGECFCPSCTHNRDLQSVYAA